MLDVKLLEALSNSFGPSGFEDEVVEVVKKHCSDMLVTNDAMNNIYIQSKECKKKKVTVMLDAHSDELGFMIQAILPNGLLSIVPLGGWHSTTIPAHEVYIKTREGELVKGVTTSKPVHFMTAEERVSSNLSVENIFIDVGASSDVEVKEVFKVGVGDPVAPDVTFNYHEKNEVYYGKAFDNRVGCFCVIETLRAIEKLTGVEVEVIGALAAQEEVGTRGAQVTSQVIKPDLAIVFEGSPADDLYYAPHLTQGALKKGVQIRHLDLGYISSPTFIAQAEKIAETHGVKYQNAVRRGGSTNAAKISLSHKAVPVLVLGIPTRYVHTHYNYCAKEDIEAAVTLAVEVIKSLTEEVIGFILKQ